MNAGGGAATGGAGGGGGMADGGGETERTATTADDAPFAGVMARTAPGPIPSSIESGGHPWGGGAPGESVTRTPSCVGVGGTNGCSPPRGSRPTSQRQMRASTAATARASSTTLGPPAEGARSRDTVARAAAECRRQTVTQAAR